MEETVMKTRKNLDFSSGPVWDEDLKRWRVEINYPDPDPDGKRKRRRFRRKRDAEIWWASQQKSIEDGSWKDVVQEAGITVGEALDRYEKCSEVHHRSHDTYASNGIGVLRKCLKPETLLCNARTADIEALKLHRLEEDGVSKTTVDKNIAVAKSFFTWCINQGLLPPGSNPAKKVSLFHENNERVRFLDHRTEYPKFLKAISDGPWYLKPMCLVGLSTGLRRGNLLRLSWKQVDFARRIITIGSQTKNGRPLMLPMNNTVLSELKKLLGVTGGLPWVFAHKEGKFAGQHITDVKNAFNGAVKRAGISDFHFHDMRHTFASWLVMKGVSLAAVQKLMGHQSMKMTLRYAHLAPKYLADEVKVLDRMMGKAKQGRQKKAEQKPKAEDGKKMATPETAASGDLQVEEGIGSSGRTRTYNPSVNSRMLYH